ncbi:kelch-like protein diablo isoform X2 [Pantherophis guttatus]|uniref:Kelch-like protein diablo isoform X2 n=1 Tax=Pantherophis guttatus TaxID=94885 RepID=A0ABM3ZL98_PANGU|nr:kelch-like protein diablo isoform X2 [Pantherophis guttatus]
MTNATDFLRDKEMQLDETSSQDSPLRRSIGQGIKELYQGQQLCDITLVADGRRFPCHRILLASVSLYFQRMLTSTFKESREGEIVLMDLSATCLQSLLDYVYTGELLLLWEEAEELFTAASRLQITSALDIITRFLRERISMENCLELYVLSYSHNHRPLLHSTSSYIAFHFEHLSELPAFLYLDVGILITIIASEILVVDSELTVYKAVRRWVTYNLAERLPKFAALMDYVRLPLLTPEELAELSLILVLPAGGRGSMSLEGTATTVIPALSFSGSQAKTPGPSAQQAYLILIMGHLGLAAYHLRCLENISSASFIGDLPQQ